MQDIDTGSEEDMTAPMSFPVMSMRRMYSWPKPKACGGLMAYMKIILVAVPSTRQASLFFMAHHHVTSEVRWSQTQTKPLPAVPVPGNTDAERMSNGLRMVLTVSKADLLKKEAALARTSAKKRAAKEPAS